MTHVSSCTHVNDSMFIVWAEPICYSGLTHASRQRCTMLTLPASRSSTVVTRKPHAGTGARVALALLAIVTFCISALTSSPILAAYQSDPDFVVSPMI